MHRVSNKAWIVPFSLIWKVKEDKECFARFNKMLFMVSDIKC